MMAVFPGAARCTKFLGVAALLLAQPALADFGEVVPPGEAEAIETIRSLIEAGVRAQAAQSGQAKRDAHAKAHGCVHGELVVDDTLPESLRKGVFQEGARYPAWIRYSNGSRQDDTEGDGRGMAIKLTEVPGEKLSSAEARTQDFLLINHPTFFVRNATDYVEFSRANANGGPREFFFPGLNPLSWRLHEMRTALTIQKKEMANPLQARYWSMTPYLMGDKPAKFSARPCDRRDLGEGMPRGLTPDYLREAMSRHLASQGACFNFLVQLQGDPAEMPVEDPTIEWDERHSRFVKVARLSIPPKSFESEAQQKFCENLSFNPWHSVPEHRPLGGINRVRRVVYETISRVRHDLNQEARVEPTGDERFAE